MEPMIALPIPRSPCRQSYTPPDSPRVTAHSEAITVTDLKQVLVELIQEAQETDRQGALEPTKPESVEHDQPKVRASKLAYKVVDEMFVFYSHLT
jgi:hypothetical protein